MLVPVMLICARHDDCPGHDLGIIGDHHTAFTRIDQLVGLKAETADLAHGADLLPVPARAQRMRRIFHHRDPARIAHGHDRIHVRGMAAHMADDHRLDFAQLGLEIFQVHAVIIAHFTQHGAAFRMHDRRRHGGKGKGRDQHLGVPRQAQRLERQEQRGRAGGHRQRVFHPHELCEFRFQQRHRRIFRCGVAEQVSRLQKTVYLGPGLGRDGFGIMHVGGLYCDVHFAFP